MSWTLGLGVTLLIVGGVFPLWRIYRLAADKPAEPLRMKGDGITIEFSLIEDSAIPDLPRPLIRSKIEQQDGDQTNVVAFPSPEGLPGVEFGLVLQNLTNYFVRYFALRSRARKR